MVHINRFYHQVELRHNYACGYLVFRIYRRVRLRFRPNPHTVISYFCIRNVQRYFAHSIGVKRNGGLAEFRNVSSVNVLYRQIQRLSTRHRVHHTYRVGLSHIPRCPVIRRAYKKNNVPGKFCLNIVNLVITISVVCPQKMRTVLNCIYVRLTRITIFK